MISRLRDRIRMVGENWGFLKLETWVLRGRERSSGEPLCFSFSGSVPLKEYQARISLADGYEEYPLGRCFVFLVSSAVSRRFPDCDMSIFELQDRHHRSARHVKAHLKNPVWMPIEIEIRDSLASSLKKWWFKTVSKNVSGHRLELEVKKDDASFDDFYHNMYLPFIQERHGTTAVISDYKGLKEATRRGELVMVRRDGLYLGGAAIDFSHKKPRMMDMGIRVGVEETVREVLSAAIYFMTFTRALERGGCTMMIGTSRGFLKDGPLNHKFHMGSVFGEGHYRKEGLLYFRVSRPSAGVKAFFSNSPLVMMDAKGNYRGAFFSVGTAGINDDFKAAIQRCAKNKMTPQLYVFADPEEFAQLLPDLKKSIPDVEILPAAQLFP